MRSPATCLRQKVPPNRRRRKPLRILNSSCATPMTSLFSFPDRSSGFVPPRLSEARLARQMSRAELARALGVTGQAIGYYESGERRPDMSVLLRLAQELEQPVSFFLRSSPPIEEHRGTRFFRSIGTRSNKINQALDVKTK